MRVQAITDLGGLRRLRPAWADLFDRCPEATPFQSPAWLLAWAEAFAPADLVTLALWRGEALAGLLPLFAHQASTGERQLTLLGNGLSDHLDLLAEPAHADEAAAAALAWLTADEAWDTWDFRDLPAGSALLRATAPVARQTQEDEAPCPALGLVDAGDVCARLPKAMRSELRRCARRLAEQGELAFATAAEDGQRRAYLFALVELHQTRWRTRGEPGVFADPRVRAFHEAATEALRAAGALRLSALTLDGRPIAVHYGLAAGQRRYSYIHAFDEAFATFAPGMLLIERVLREAVDEGAEAFDFLRGAEPYKYRWGARDQPKRRWRAWR